MIKFLKNNVVIRKYKILGLLFFIASPIIAQEEISNPEICPPKTILEIFKKKEDLLVVKPTKNNFFLIIPAIGSQPATGFFFGAVAQYTFKGKEEKAKYSIANVGITYTLKNQWLVNIKNNILLKNNKIFLSGDYRL